MSQQCFIEFRDGEYAGQGKTSISWFSRICWNFDALSAITLLYTNKKNQPKYFPPFETISSSSKSWYKAVLTFLVRKTWHSFAPLADNTQNINWTIIMGLHYYDKCSENMWPSSCWRLALSSALQSKKQHSRENSIKLQIPKIFHHFDQECTFLYSNYSVL